MSEYDSEEVFYPETDGKPMAETDTHRNNMIDLILMLRSHFRHQPEVYVTGNILLYYVKGDNTKSVSPDMMVVRGVGNRERDTYKTWEEGKGPDVVIEVTSCWTQFEDIEKKDLYEQVLRVPEYFLYDPFQHYLEEGMHGYRLVEGRYQEMKPIVPRRWWSEELKLELVFAGTRLRLYDPAIGEYLLTPEEIAVRIEEEVRARREAEMIVEIARLRAEPERLKKEKNLEP